MPPVAGGRLPWLGAAPGLLRDPTGWFAHQRETNGDTFVVDALAERRRRPDRRTGDFLDQIDESFAEVTGPDHDRLVARDVIVLHLGSQSNLFAAMAWTLVHLLAAPADLEAVRLGDTGLLDRYAYEAIRTAQRSITMRQVLRPLTFETDVGPIDLQPGVLITTMLSVLNTTVDDRLATFDPAHYDGRRLRLADELPAKELVSTFGHGIHLCPAQRFSITAIRTAVRRLVDRFDLTAEFSMPGPLPRQIGGVARADRPTPVRYRSR